jgi:ribosome-binding protein aMBF1 (putative translation factor)
LSRLDVTKWKIQSARTRKAEIGIMIDKTAGEPIGDLIRNLRQRRGLTQGGLAGKLVDVSGNDGMNRRQVARWERGKRIPSRYWRNWIGIALDIPLTTPNNIDLGIG